MSDQDLPKIEDCLALLARTPAALDALLRGLPDAWILRGEGEGTWSAFDVVGHLIHCDRTDWMPRARHILDHGETHPFPPFDRMGHYQIVQGRSLAELLDDFARTRAQSLAALHDLHLSEEDFRRTGRHPAFGPVSLSELLTTWAAHDLTHLHQLARVMAVQVREAVGPFSRYLGVLQCTGHSAAS